jgi:HSP20 family protein
MGLLARRSRDVDVFDRMERWLDEWFAPMRWPAWPAFFGEEWSGAAPIRVDEFREDGTLVVRAELPGIDPDKDVEITVSDGMLTIEARREEEEKASGRDWLRHELRYGAFRRTLPLPEGVSESDIKASYKDGILEIRVPVPAEPASAARRVPVTRAS